MEQFSGRLISVPFEIMPISSWVRGRWGQSIKRLPPWRNRLARSAVNRKVGGSSPPRGAKLFVDPPFFCDLETFSAG